LDGAIHGANGPANPHRPASDRLPRSVGTAFCFGRCRPWSTRMPEEPAFAFDFSFDLPAVRRKLSVAGRVGRLGA
ncbi:hypothetical protein, partial [Stenotrophomonas sp. FR010]|uniref:hypothetical protein n=1 Tax=Stenotrophomonas sp. FR010 TaxID=3398458 RepID=UPI0039C5E604